MLSRRNFLALSASGAALAASGLPALRPAAAADPGKLTVVISSASFEPGTSTLTSLPDALGFWKEDGLEVTLRSARGSALGAQIVMTGEADVVHAGTSVGLMQPVAQGADLKAWYNMIIHNFQMPAVPEDSPIKTLADLKGKKLGVIGQATATIPIVKAVLEDAGLDPETDVTFVDVGYGAQAAAALWVTKRVDGLAMYDSVYAAIENVDPTKYKLRIISSPLADRVSFQTALISRSETLANKRKELIALGKGQAKASIFALTNPEAAVRLHWQRYPEQRKAGMDEAVALDQEIRGLMARLTNMRIDTMAVKRDKWGYMDPIDVSTYLEMLQKIGSISKDVKANQLYTNDLIAGINDFDAKAIVEMAKNYKVKG